MIDIEHLHAVEKHSTCLLTQEEVLSGCASAGMKISDDYAEKQPILLTVMVGGLVSTSHLMQYITCPMELDYIHMTRYGKSTFGSNLSFEATPSISLQGRHVIVVDDILDKGITLAEVVRFCEKEGAASVKTFVLLDKTVERDPQGMQSADYVAVTVPDAFVYGMGIDYRGFLRNARGIYGVDGAFLDNLTD